MATFDDAFPIDQTQVGFAPVLDSPQYAAPHPDPAVETLLSHSTAASPSADSDNAVTLKMLVTNNVAGSLIGKKGATINELQSTSGARIKLSQASDFFPGTRDRIVLVLGHLEAVNRAQALVMERVFQDQQQAAARSQFAGGSSAEFPAPTMDPNATMQGRFVIPSRSAGVLIGQGGANIKDLHEKSGARIQLHSRSSPGDNVQEVLKERTVMVMGTLASCVKAIELSLRKLVEEHTLDNPAGTLKYQNMTTSYSRLMTSVIGGVGFPHPGLGGGPSLVSLGSNPNHIGVPIYQQPMFSAYETGGRRPQPGLGAAFPLGASSQQTVTVQLPVPDSMIGVILGRGGARLNELQQISGARVTVSQRNEFIPGTNNRTVTIVGTQQAAQNAEILIQQKLAQGGTFGASGPPPMAQQHTSMLPQQILMPPQGAPQFPPAHQQHLAGTQT